MTLPPHVHDDFTTTLDDLSSVTQHIREARSRERTARFYRLSHGPEHIGNGIELNNSWVIMTWLDLHSPIKVYRTILDCHADLEDGYVLLLDDVSDSTEAGKLTLLGKENRLTERERSILRALRLGLSNEEIATALSLSASTIKNKLSMIYSKLGSNTHSRVQAVLLTNDWNLDDDD